VIGGARYTAGAFAPRSIGPRVILGVPFRSFSSPYYAFRPRASLAFGLVVGYPVAFPNYAPAYPYPYPYAPAYPYAIAGPTYGYGSLSSPTDAAIPPSPSTEVPSGDLGGLSFAITPGDAQVLVDGQVVGVVSSFSPTSQPLTLTPGHHHVEIRASGYRSVAFDVDITPGEVIPYYGTLER
jgi:hypothetical protein